MADIRTLQADEIDCRVGIAKNNAVSILLYKNSRVDMAILDEVYGPANWMRDHKELKGVIYCGVAVKFGDAWIWKWDAGVESNTEPQKGEASDSFKRACVNWGIGRELYTAPFIWIKLSAEEWNNGKPRISFHVSEIAYDSKRTITKLTIVDESGAERYTMRPAKKAPKQAPKTKPEPSAEQTLTHVTMALYTAGKCRNVVEFLKGQYDAKEKAIPDEAQDYARSRFNWDEDAFNAVVKEATEKAISNS